MADVRITVPPENAELFKKEAADTLDYAIGCVNDALRCERRGTGDGSKVSRYRAMVDDAELVHDQVRDQGGTLLVDGDAHVISTTLEGCLLNAGDDVKGATEERRGPETRAKVRRAMADVALWLSLLEQVEEEVGLEAVFA